jgi:hypothetical protein
MTITGARTDHGLYEFLPAEARDSHGGALFSGNPASGFTPVEKYLPDNAVLRTDRKRCVAYLAENKSNAGPVFDVAF